MNDIAQQRHRGVQRVLYITLFLNILVAVSKIVIGTLAHSIAIRADGFHSSADGLNNIVLLFATAFAAKPADDDHPYGHRKIEIFAAVSVGLLLLYVAFNLGNDVVSRLRGSTQETVNMSPLALGVVGFTLAVNIFIAVYERQQGIKLKSPALVADAAHTGSDIAVTIGVLCSSLLVFFGVNPIVDSIFGIIVAIFIAVTGLSIVRKNASFLADTVVVDPMQVVEAALTVSGVRRAHDAKSRGIPGFAMVDLTIEVDGNITVDAGHSISHDVEDAVKQKIEGVAQVLVHVEPHPQNPSKQ